MEPVPILSFTCHDSTHPAIDPSNAKNDYLSMPGRSVLITGANKSTGAATVHFDRPSLRIFHLHPGTVKSGMCRKCGVDQDSEEIIFDDADLPTNFSVWLASSKADLLNGRTIETMWGVEETEKAKETILADERVFKIGLQGRGFVPLLKEQLK